MRLFSRVPGLGFLSPIRWLRRMATLVVLLYVAAAAGEVLLESRLDDGKTQAQAIVVLGAAQYDGRPSPVLRGRLDHALELYNAKRAPLIVVTGGRQKGDRITEASASANYLIRRGVADRHIAREVQGTNTYESLAATARFLKKRDITSVLLVTDGYHAARVSAIAAEVGLDPHTSPVSDTVSMGRLLRETGAMAVGRVVGFRRLSAWLS